MEGKDHGGRERLLFVVNHPGFFLSHRVELARAARAAGYDVHVATPPGGEAGRIVAEGFRFHPIRLDRGGLGLLSALVSFASIARLFRRLRPDLVHLVTIKPILLGGLAARLLCVPAAVHAVPGLGWLFLARGRRAALLRAGVRAGYRIVFGHPNCRAIVQNPDDRAELTRGGVLDPARAVLIRGAGVDLEEFRPAPEAPGPPVVVLPARMIRDKGVPEFVSAARLLREEGVQARFVLCGEPDPANPHAIDPAELRAWHEEGAVEWWGRREDMPAVLAGSHVVCLPSYREGVPKALLEAAATGRPIVTTDAPGCREAVRDGETGLLVPPRDPEALAAALRALLRDPARRRSMGEAGRRFAVDAFGVDRVVERTLEVYRALSARSVRSTSLSTPNSSTMRGRVAAGGRRS